MRALSIIDWIVILLVFLGGINWGLVGVLNFNLIEFIFSQAPIIARIIYILVALAAIYLLFISLTLVKK
jgi:hypothetical protein